MPTYYPNKSGVSPYSRNPTFPNNLWIPLTAYIRRETPKALMLQIYEEGEDAPYAPRFWAPKSILHSVTPQALWEGSLAYSLPITLFLPRWFCQKADIPYTTTVQTSAIRQLDQEAVTNCALRVLLDSTLPGSTITTPFPAAPTPMTLAAFRKEGEEDTTQTLQDSRNQQAANAVEERERLAFLKSNWNNLDQLPPYPGKLAMRGPSPSLPRSLPPPPTFAKTKRAIRVTERPQEEE